MTANATAGPLARTGTDASLPQNSSGTRCDDCQHRQATGMNPDGRSLCRPCARRSRTLIPDGGHTYAEFDEAKALAQDAVNSFPHVNEETVTVRHNHSFVTVDTEQGTRLRPGLVERIERDAGLRLRAVEPYETVKNGVRARFRFEESTEDASGVLDRLAGQFERRRDQAEIAGKEYEKMNEEQAADFQAGRVVGLHDALAAVRHEQGDADE